MTAFPVSNVIERQPRCAGEGGHVTSAQVMGYIRVLLCVGQCACFEEYNSYGMARNMNVSCDFSTLQRQWIM